MRFARVVSAFDCCNPCIDPLVERSDLNVLQLDYQWPTNRTLHGPTTPRHNTAGITAAGKGEETQLWQSYAPGLLKQLRTLHKSLYLDPSLHIVTNAGGGDTQRCVEALAEFLCEHRDAELPITAIRGDNVGAHLEAMMAEGIELKDIATGRPLHELTRSLVAAQVEIGAGPLKTALDEGSRFIVAGCYDEAAPLIAAAMSATPLAWDRMDKLAQLAVAARYQQTIVDFDEALQLAMVSQPGLPLPGMPLAWFPHRWNQDSRPTAVSAATTGTVKHADVHYQASDCEIVRVAEGAHRPKITGQPSTGKWLLRVRYLAEYIAEAVWEFEHADRKSWESMSTTLRSQLGYEAPDAPLEIDSMRSDFETPFETPFEKSTPAIIRARFRSLDRRCCDEFLDAVKNYVARTEPLRGPGTGALATVRCQMADFYCEVPREAIAVSVDTRPAKEWR